MWIVTRESVFVIVSQDVLVLELRLTPGHLGLRKDADRRTCCHHDRQNTSGPSFHDHLASIRDRDHAQPIVRQSGPPAGCDGTSRDIEDPAGCYDRESRQMAITIDLLRRFAVARALFPPTTLSRAIERCGFVQADPIRAPARAQDLTLRHRVTAYRAGDLERRYERLDIEEDVFVNYGFMPRAVHGLMHPRRYASEWPPPRRRRAQKLLEFIRARGTVHPREVDAHFSHGTVVNYWGGSSNATTHLLEEMHYAGLVRVVRREAGIRIYSAREPASDPPDSRDGRGKLDALVDVAVRVYAPLPAASLSHLVSRLRYGAPQWRGDLREALRRARARLAHARVEGIDWFWPADDRPSAAPSANVVRLLSPFDPVVWDRRRFEMLWAWGYRFEAYTPVPKRRLGYYALPLLWRDRVIGWGNLTLKNGSLHCVFGYVGSQPRSRAFNRELDAEIARMRAFLGVSG